MDRISSGFLPSRPGTHRAKTNQNDNQTKPNRQQKRLSATKKHGPRKRHAREWLSGFAESGYRSNGTERNDTGGPFVAAACRDTTRREKDRLRIGVRVVPAEDRTTDP
mmetsp:Transcript_5188/g.10871  ORF Transcript_5188/g.10871 Transcript_5188/m.10871 type:complete len:108 (+) Transcript_5188:169-492(+)